jgi:hypothetical protein
MVNEDRSCHGHRMCLQTAGYANLGVFAKFRYHTRTRGAREALKRLISKILRKLGVSRILHRTSQSSVKAEQRALRRDEEVLDLQPGETIEVKSETEILATLDASGKYKGLLWMPSMSRFCGKRYQVFKRLNIILLESTLEFKKVRHTVLLEGVLCDGNGFYGCDRSCFHYWREAWLRRVSPDGTLASHAETSRPI